MSMYEAFETILYERRDRVAVVTLDRPERLNAINGRMSVELAAVWEEVKRDPDVCVVVVTGAGEKAFCTGFDLAYIASGYGLQILDGRFLDIPAGVQFPGVFQQICQFFFKPGQTFPGSFILFLFQGFALDLDLPGRRIDIG